MDKEALRKARLPEREVTLDGVGVVLVRGLSRTEAMTIGKFADDPDAGEVWMLTRGVVDPALSEEDVRAWRDAAPPAEVDLVLQAIADLSGLGESVREAVRAFPDRPEPAGGVRGG
jgi:hypothetical protein